MRQLVCGQVESVGTFLSSRREGKRTHELVSESGAFAEGGRDGRSGPLAVRHLVEDDLRVELAGDVELDVAQDPARAYEVAHVERERVEGRGGEAPGGRNEGELSCAFVGGFALPIGHGCHDSCGVSRWRGGERAAARSRRPRCAGWGRRPRAAPMAWSTVPQCAHSASEVVAAVSQARRAAQRGRRPRSSSSSCSRLDPPLALAEPASRARHGLLQPLRRTRAGLDTLQVRRHAPRCVRSPPSLNLGPARADHAPVRAESATQALLDGKGSDRWTNRCAPLRTRSSPPRPLPRDEAVLTLPPSPQQLYHPLQQNRLTRTRKLVYLDLDQQHRRVRRAHNPKAPGEPDQAVVLHPRRRRAAQRLRLGPQSARPLELCRLYRLVQAGASVSRSPSPSRPAESGLVRRKRRSTRTRAPRTTSSSPRRSSVGPASQSASESATGASLLALVLVDRA